LHKLQNHLTSEHRLGDLRHGGQAACRHWPPATPSAPAPAPPASSSSRRCPGLDDWAGTRYVPLRCKDKTSAEETAQLTVEYLLSGDRHHRYSTVSDRRQRVQPQSSCLLPSGCSAPIRRAVSLSPGRRGSACAAGSSRT
jgi:hypothetical protein